jgi:glycosyltransferase involved in cell wall biosynthesis
MRTIVAPGHAAAVLESRSILAPVGMTAEGGTNGRRPRLLVLNQYYWPGVEATANLLADLCRGLADQFDITVVTGRVRDVPNLPERERHDGVDIIRVRSTAYDRRQLSRRAVNYLTYLVESLREGHRVPRPDVILAMTDPPIIGDVALILARRFRVPLVVVSEDVFPEIAVELNRLTNPAAVALLRAAVHYYLKRADRLVAIGETMRRRLVAKGAPPERVRVIPNWVNTKVLQPQPRANEWSEANDLVDRFVVMHSGNVGHAQNLDALVRAATFLRDLDDLSIVIVGTGARHVDLVRLAKRLEVDSVRFLPYQPRELLPLSLSAAHVHVVGLARRLAGYVVPSRLYGILSVGRPVVVAADEESETAQVIREIGCGVVVPPGRPELLAATIRDAYDGNLPLEEMGRNARGWVVREADREVAVERYRRVLDELVDARR